MQTATLGVIGAGNMGTAIVRGCVEAGVAPPQHVIIADVDAQKLAQCKALGCRTTTSPAGACEAQQIILAVKPQVFPSLAQSIGPLRQRRIIISIMAGLSSRVIRAALGEHARVIRAMPNTPCQIGAGMTAIALGDGAAAGDEALAIELFNALGRTVIVEEAHMHAVTAVSGSGPAYVFVLAEAMEQAAIALDLPPAVARALVQQTIYGAGRLLADTQETPSQLRKAVTSPGGTTATALEVFERRELERIVIEALTAARDRGIQLDQHR